MWNYEKRLEYPINIKQTNPALAAMIISQYGGPYFNKVYTTESHCLCGIRDFHKFKKDGFCICFVCCFNITHNIPPYFNKVYLANRVHFAPC